MSEDKKFIGPEGKDYTFIQEKIVPRRKRKVKKILLAAVGTFFLAVLFGLIARITFEYSGPLLEFLFGRPSGRGNIQLAGGQDGGPGGVTGSIVTDGPNEGSGSSITGEKPIIKEEEEPVVSPSAIVVENYIEADLEDLSRMYYLLGDMANEVNRSIVTVSGIYNGVDWFQNPYEASNDTSGVILAIDDSKIYVMVSYARIQEADKLKITFRQGKTVDARLQQADEDIGIAVVAADTAELTENEKNALRIAPLGESYSLRTGEPVLALGNPDGYMYSMLFGIVTNQVSYAYVPDMKVELLNTDMMVYENGEGILVNLKGEVVGILANSFGSEDGSGTLCKALAVSRVKSLLENLINQTPRLYFGVIAKDMTEAISEKSGKKNGIYIEEVMDGSPAELAGIKAGDVLLSIDGTPVSTVAGFSIMIQNYKSGDTLKVEAGRMNRKGIEEFEFEVIIARRN